MSIYTIKQKILSSINIVDLIKNFLSIEKKGSNYQAICPFHSDTKPSLVISEEKQIFTCFACSVSGNAIKFITKFKKLNNELEALEEIAKIFNLESLLTDLDKSKSNFDKNELRFYEINNLVADWFNFFLSQDDEASNYLKSRNISEEIIKEFNLGYSKKERNYLSDNLTNANGDRIVSENDRTIFNIKEVIDSKLVTIDESSNMYDFFRNRLMFPIRDINKNVVAFSARTLTNENPKYLNSPTSKYFKKDEILFNEDKAFENIKNETLYIVEGFMDVFSLYHIGIKNVVATMGTSFSEKHLKKIINTKKVKSIILALDNDQAGSNANEKIANIIKNKLDLYILKDWETELKDFDDVLWKEGEDKLKKIINNNLDYCFKLIFDLSNDYDKNNKSQEKSYRQKLKKIILDFGIADYYDQYLKTIKSFFDIEIDLDSKTTSNREIVSSSDNTLSYIENDLNELYQNLAERLLFWYFAFNKTDEVLKKNNLSHFLKIYEKELNLIIKLQKNFEGDSILDIETSKVIEFLKSINTTKETIKFISWLHEKILFEFSKNKPSEIELNKVIKRLKEFEKKWKKYNSLEMLTSSKPKTKEEKLKLWKVIIS